MIKFSEKSNIKNIILLEEAQDTYKLKEDYKIKDIFFKKEYITPRKYILSCDYSSQEYKVLALLSKDSKMIQNFKEGIDPHTATTYALYGKENFTKELRKKGKGFNFRINYGGGAFGISEELEITYEEACEILNNYEETFFECMQWKKQKIEEMYRNNGVVYTIFGRPRRLGSYIRTGVQYSEEGDEKASRGIINAAERRVCSHEVQGFCGDIMRYVLIKLYDKYFKVKDPNIDFLSTIHDEINVVITESEAIRYARELEDLMLFKLPEWQLKIDVTIGLGRSYGSVFDFEWTNESRTELAPKRLK
jgi:DNA polymerase-1